MSKRKRGHYSGIGGQAVIEGVMMKNQDRYAVAVRTPSGEIEVALEEYESFAPAKILTRIPFIRGIFNFIDSLILGTKTLTYSASFYEEVDDKKQKEKPLDKALGDNSGKVLSVFSVILSVILAIWISAPLRRLSAEIQRMHAEIGTEELEPQGYTETRVLAERINRMNEQAKVLNDSRQQFVSNVSHELKTPLTSMKRVGEFPVSFLKSFI